MAVRQALQKQPSNQGQMSAGSEVREVSCDTHSARALEAASMAVAVVEMARKVRATDHVAGSDSVMGRWLAVGSAERAAAAVVGSTIARDLPYMNGHQMVRSGELCRLDGMCRNQDSLLGAGGLLLRRVRSTTAAVPTCEHPSEWKGQCKNLVEKRVEGVAEAAMDRGRL